MVSGLLEPLEEIAGQFTSGQKNKIQQALYDLNHLVAESPCSQSKFWLCKKLWRITFGISCIFPNVIEIVPTTSDKNNGYYSRSDNVRSGLKTLDRWSPAFADLHHWYWSFVSVCSSLPITSVAPRHFWRAWWFVNDHVMQLKKIYVCIYVSISESILFPFVDQEVTR